MIQQTEPIILVDGSYEITEIDLLEHQETYAIWNSLVKIDSTHFSLAYQGPGSDGYIKTFSVDDLCEESTKRINDLREAETRRVDQSLLTFKEHISELMTAEAKRLDAIRELDYK